MVCYSPLRAFRSWKFLTSNGTRQIIFDGSWRFNKDYPVDSQLEIYDFLEKEKKANEALSLEDRIEHLCIPCGQCIGCRLSHARDWTGRIICESQLYDGSSSLVDYDCSSCFVTLTYSDTYLPRTEGYLGTLVKKHFQNFMKRLRKSIYPKKVRFYACGEYGEKYQRPHFHVILFGYLPEDLVMFSDEFGHKLYISESLQKLWKFGFVSIGNLTFDSAMYVAGYVTKKITGDKAESHYLGREPEFSLMSRKPGIGKDWIEQFYGDVYNHDKLVLDDQHVVKPSRYFDSVFQNNHATSWLDVKAKREDISKVSCREFYLRENYANIMQSKKDFERMIKNDL